MSSEPSPYYKFYHYDPSLAGACIFTALFGVTTVWHSISIARHRTWYFIPTIVGGIFEITGYAARAVSSKQVPNLTLAPYVVQTLLLLVAPPLFAASIYMILSRIIASVDGDHYSLIKRKWLTKVFVASDSVSFVVQLGGAGLMASANASSSKTGSYIVLVGLLIQIVLFGFFVVISLVFHSRLHAMPTRESCSALVPWKRFMYILYINSALIMVRSIVRVAEFVQGFEGFIILHEVFLYVFDAVPMAAVMIIFNIWYPSCFSKEARAKAARTSADSSTELSNVELQNV